MQATYFYRLVRSIPGVSRVAFAAVVIALSGGAGAQEEAGRELFEEITVTAEKRETSLLDTPLSITAISARTLRDFNINSLGDIATIVPGFSSRSFEGKTQNRGPQSVGLRGVQTLSLTWFSGQNTIGYYINETPVPVVNPRLVDLERVEVLRGPQGTLYGSSSLGGTIKLVTAQPSTEESDGQFDVYLTSTKDGSEGGLIEGSFNAPLSDRVALRASAYFESDPGYVDFREIDLSGAETGVAIEDANEGESYGGRIGLLFQVTEDFSITPSLMYNRRESDTGDFFNGEDFQQLNHIMLPAEDDFYIADILINWDIGPGSITSSTSYFEADSVLQRNATALPFAGALPNPAVLPWETTISQEQFTHETRYVSDLDGNFQFVAGLFYTDQTEESGNFASAQGNDNIFGIPIVNDTLLGSRSWRDREELAIFGEGTLSFGERWALTVGLRWFDFDFFTRDNLFGVFAQFDDGQGSTDDGVVPRVRVEFDASENTLLYASYSEGFRMGGANFPVPDLQPCTDGAIAFFGSPDIPRSYESDSLSSYEVGVKSGSASNRINVAFSVYYIDWEDTQVPVTLGACPLSGLSTNVGSVESQGFELEVNWAPIDSLNLWLGIGYNDVEVAEELSFPDATVVIAQAGDPLPDVPEWTGSFRGEYRIPMGTSWDGFVRADYRYVEKTTVFLGVNTVEREEINVLNLRLGADSESGWSPYLFVDNALDESPSLGPYTFGITVGGNGSPWDVSIRPRTIGVGVGKQF